jgi:hypothetical protein
MVNAPDWLKIFTVARKAGVSLLGGAATVAAAGLLPEPWDKYGPIIIVLATYYGVFWTRNVPSSVGKGPLDDHGDDQYPGRHVE